MQNLFIIRSPFQLICAIEAANHFKCKNNTGCDKCWDRHLLVRDRQHSIELGWKIISKIFEIV